MSKLIVLKVEHKVKRAMEYLAQVQKELLKLTSSETPKKKKRSYKKK